MLNHSSKTSYPEQYFIECFSKFSNVVFQHHIFRYHVDFANVEEKLYLEIDGDQHYLDKKILDHDIRRTVELTELGWTGYRLRWSEFQKLTDEEKRCRVHKLGLMMKWLS